MSFSDTLKRATRTAQQSNTARRASDAKRERENSRRIAKVAKQTRSNSAADRRESQRQEAVDKAQDVNLQALENDVARIDEKRKNGYKAATQSIKNLKRQIRRGDKVQDAKIQAVMDATEQEEREAARMGAALRATLASLPGAGELDGILSNALKDGRLNISELTQLSHKAFMYAVLSSQTLRDEIAANTGDLELLDGEVAALEWKCTGIDANAQTISGLASTLTDQGYIDSGDFMTNLSNGAVFFNGRRMDADAFILGLTALKSARVHVEIDREDEDFADWFMTEKDAASVIVGHRIISTTENAVVRDSDGKGFGTASSGGFQEVSASEGTWATGTLVEIKGELGLAPDLDGIVKVAGAFGISTFDRWYTTVLPLFSEKLGSFLGLGEGIDFAANVSDDD
jgi:hypothetical protein